MGRKIKPLTLLLFVFICLALIASAIFTVYHAKSRIKRGLDIAGGLYVLLEAVETGDEEVGCHPARHRGDQDARG